MRYHISKSPKPFTSITTAFLSDDVEKTLKSIFKCNNLLNGSVSFGQLLKKQQAL